MNTAQEKFVYYYKKYKDQPVKVLLGFYRGSYHKFVISAFFYLIKHSPTLFSSLLIANVINGVLAGGDEARRAIIINVAIWIGLLCIHLPANYLHSMYRSRVIRSTEAGLREAMVRKLQELSIPYHTQIQSGRLQSKIIRDVEAIETHDRDHGHQEPDHSDLFCPRGAGRIAHGLRFPQEDRPDQQGLPS